MEQIKHLKRWIRAIIIATGCFILSLILYYTNTFTVFENKTYDQRMVFASKYIRTSDDIYFVGVDQNSIKWAEQEYGWSWPWPREAYAKMIEFFSAGNAESIAFDILYTEPSIYGSSDDEALGKAEQKSGKVIQTIYFSSTPNGIRVDRPIPVIEKNAVMLGNINSVMDEDDIIRRGRLEFEYNGITYPTLGTAPVHLTGQQDLIEKAPRLKDNSVLLRYARNIDCYYPFWAADILESYENWKAGKESFYTPEDFEGAYIFVAYYAPGLFDICSTPVSQVFPGVGVHMTTLDNLLNNSFMRKAPDFTLWIYLLFISLFASIIVTLSSAQHKQIHTVITLILCFVCGVIITVIIPYILFANGIWIQLICPATTFLFAYFITMAVNFTIEGKQRRFIKNAFSQCLSKEVVNLIVSDPESFKLSGKKVFMTALFSDIRKFSSLSELLSPEQIGEFLNYYLTKMSNVIVQEGGIIDKYEGDSIVAMIGAPIEMEDHAARAVRAAINMKKAEALMNKEITETASSPMPADMNPSLYEAFTILIQNKKDLFTRIGINSGEMIAGFFGSEEVKKNYTIMGNNVNLASRLEGVNKQYSTNGIIISEATAKLIGNEFIIRKLDRVRVVNVNTPIRLYEVLDFADNEKTKDYANRWNEAMDLFENENWQEAATQFKMFCNENPQDHVAEYYLGITENFFLKGIIPAAAHSIGVVYDAENKVFNLMQK